MRAVLFAVAVPVAPSAAFADFTGRVVNVADGDTLTVLVNKTQMRVRLDSIDAPERAQAFGKRSQQSLAQLCAAKDAHVAERGKDRYGRAIGVVTRGGGGQQRAGAPGDGLGVREVCTGWLVALRPGRRGTHV